MSCYVQLRRYLAERYPKDDEARRLGRDASVDIAEVNFQGAAITFWANLIEEANYQKKLENLLTQIREDERSQEALVNQFLEEVKSSSFDRIPPRHRPNRPSTTLDQVDRLISERTRQFFGRDDQLSELDRFVAENERGVMIVTAPGGFGKSALLANWVRRQENRGALVAFHFFNVTMHRTVQPADALKGLLFQITTLRNREPPDLSGDNAKLEDSLNATLCEDASADEPLIVVLDGLDEATQIIEPIMPTGLGKHVYIVASGRAGESERPSHLAFWLYDLNSAGYPGERFPLKPLDIAGVMQWLNERAPNLQENANAIAKRLLATTDGIPLFLRFIVDDIRQQLEKGTPAADVGESLLTLPERFSNYAARQLEAMRRLLGSTEGWIEIQRIFALLTLIRGALPASEIAVVLGFQSDVTTLNASIRRWFAISLGEKEASVAFLHPRLAEVFRDALAKSPQTQGLVHEVEQSLINHCEGWQKNGSFYGLLHLPWHLMQNGQTKEAFEVLTSIDFLGARVSNPYGLVLTREDFRSLKDKAPADLQSKVRSWLSFWATIELRLFEISIGPRPKEAASVLRQLLVDTPEAPSHTLSQAERDEISWSQLTGRRAPSSLLRTLNHANSVVGALALSDDRILSWSYDALQLWAGDGTQLRRLKCHTWVKGALELRDHRLLSWSEDATLRLWAANGDPLRELNGHTKEVWGFVGALELGDGRILSWSDDATLRLWAANGDFLCELKGHTALVWGALELCDGGILSWSADGTLRLWAADGTQLDTLNGHVSWWHVKRWIDFGDLDPWVEGALQLADGRLLSWDTCGTLRLWAGDGTPLRKLKGHIAHVRGALELADRRLLSWSEDATLRLWAGDGTPLRRLMGHTAPVRGTLELGDGRILSWSEDGTLQLWAANGDSLHELKGHTAPVRGASELGDGRILSWSEDGTLRFWGARGAQLGGMKGHTGAVKGALELNDGRLLSWSSDETLRLWAGNDGAPLDEKSHTAQVNGALALADGGLLSWSKDKTLRLWATDGTPHRELQGHTASVDGALALADGRLLSWSADETLRLWNADGTLLRKLDGHESSVIGAVALGDGRFLSWSLDTVRLWARDGTLLRKLKGRFWRGSPERNISGALELADGRLCSWSKRTGLMLWNKEGAPLRKLEGRSSREAIAINLVDDKLMKTGDRWDLDWVDGALELGNGRLLSWSHEVLALWTADGALFELKGHTHVINGALELKSGRILSWSDDDTLRLWDAEGASLAELKGHRDPVRGALELANGRILSWGDDDTLRLWDDEGAPLAELKGHCYSAKGALELANRAILSWSGEGMLRLWASNGSALQPWLWPYAGLQKVIPHATLADHFWVVAGNDVLLVCYRGVTKPE